MSRRVEPSRIPALLFGLMFLTLAGPARAQDGNAAVVLDPDRPGTSPVVRVTLGLIGPDQDAWGGRLVAERWNPVYLDIAGPESADGFVVARYVQDGSQTVRTVMPFAVTAGQTTRHELLVCPPVHMRELSLRFVSARQRTIGEILFSSNGGSARNEQPLTLPATKTGPLVLTVGADSAAHVFPTGIQPPEDVSLRAPVDQPSDQPQDRLHDQPPPPPGGDPEPSPAPIAIPGATRVALQPDELPASALAYDAVDVVVIEADPNLRLDPRRLAALHEWVRSGGVLVIQADAPGDLWSALLPHSEPAPVTLAPVARGPMPPEVVALLGDTPASDRVAFRAPALTPSGEAHGWTVGWGNPQPALAHGPVGFGTVVVLGLDPARVPEVLDQRAAASVWSAVLGGHLDVQAEHDDRSWISVKPSGATHQERAALTSSLDAIVPGVAPSSASFVVIVLGMGVLVFCVSLGDMFWLRRLKLRQHAWLSALFWIAIASLVAGFAPGVVRTSEDRLLRLTVTDTVLAEAPLSRTTGLTALLSGANQQRILVPAPNTTAWRGVSSVTSWGESPVAARLNTLTTVQRQGTLRPSPLELKTWTLRTFLDESAPAPTASATVRRVGDEYELAVVGMPEDARLRGARLIFYDHAWVSLRSEDPPVGPTFTTYARTGAGVMRPWMPDSTGSRRSDELDAIFGGPAAARPFKAEHAFGLTGPSRRHSAIERRLATGRWAVVLLEFESKRSALAIDADTPIQLLALHRILVPVDDPEVSP